MMQDYSIKVIDEKGLIHAVNHSDQKISKYAYAYVKDIFIGFLGFERCDMRDHNLVLDGFPKKYSKKKWDIVAPYLLGYIEYNNKETLFRDLFEPGKPLRKETPWISWLSDGWFYEEKWGVSDLIPAMRKYHIPLTKENLDKIKKMVIVNFYDTSVREKVIDDIVSKLKEE